ncbi:DUF433 domain-containing protein [Plectonema cf. radiosum LEGE 06105]|uniref:DUF433 domain-containing protein n=1 Tax=Plectonema cf. radiosum LEGE 06105 TaxID=945769 RepID=A0A8J7F6W2_9CYAN|nr:DUF433 domain-containing protein [Plectonema radiosum]MBE9216748.1 DUF433 domain-containing protein [Plectonema cf. radiosum LEGE 06105]
MATTVDIGKLIASSPETCGNRPLIAGTRVSVLQIAVMSKEGLTPQKIAEEFGFINLAQVHAALAYYYANQEEIENYLAEEEAEYKRLETESIAG